MKLNSYAKAFIAAVVAGYAMLEVSIEPVIVDGDIVEAAGVVTRTELIRIGGAVVAALALVWGVPNAAVDQYKTLKAKFPKADYSRVTPLPPVVGDGSAGDSNQER